MIELEPIGIDLAFIQGRVNFRLARAAGVLFALIRFLQGGDWSDSRALENWRGAKAEKHLRGPYLVWDERRGHGGQDHFQHFLRVFPDDDRGEFPAVIDLELHPVTWSELRVFYDLLLGYFGRAPWLYSGAWALNQLEVPLWVQMMVHWLTGYNEIGPTMPRAYTPRVLIWQKSDSWHVDWVRT